MVRTKPRSKFRVPSSEFRVGTEQVVLGRATASQVATKKVVALSPQELKVIGCRAVGMSYKETAAALKLSPKTVQNYLARIFDKTGARSSLGVIYALRVKRPS